MRTVRNLAFALMTLCASLAFATGTQAAATSCSDGTGLPCNGTSCCYFDQWACQYYNGPSCEEACHFIGCEYDWTFCPLNPFSDMYCPYCICKDWP